MTCFDIELAEYQYLASQGGYAGIKSLSDTTALLCLILLSQASNDDMWLGAFLDGLTPTERDEIDAFVSQASNEIMTDIEPMLLPRYQFLYSWAFEPIAPTTVQKGYSASAYNGSYVWTNSNVNGDGIYVPLQLRAGDYKAYFNLNYSTVGGEIYPEIWDAYNSSVLSLTEFNSYANPGGYNNQVVRSFTLDNDIDSGYLKLGINTSPSSSGARSITLQEVIIVGVE